MSQDSVSQVDADQDQRRFQRNRSEGINGQTMWVAVLVPDRDDRYTGGELGARTAEEPRVEGRLRVPARSA